MSTLFSGVKPTGQSHLGNYLGAYRSWVELQSQHRCLYGIMDLHALTIKQEPAALRAQTMELAVDLLALGIDPERSTLFVQSHVSQHAELGWLLGCLVSVTELQRMTQFKDKSARDPRNVNAGLLTYPCLMAADMLLYHAEVVPVGEDQLQHLELARLLARKLQKQYGLAIPEPRPHHLKPVRIMSLSDPAKKMGKDLGPPSYVALRDEPAAIARKVSRAVTDTGRGDSAGAQNLLSLLREFAPAKVHTQFDRAAQDGSLRYAELKAALAQAVAAHFAPYRERVKELEAKPAYVREVLEAGAAKARQLAVKNLAAIWEKVGLLP